MKYLVIFERAGDNFSAYAPDVPGCVATGKTRKAVAGNIKEALLMHISGMKKDSEEIPIPQASAGYVEVKIGKK